MMEIKFKDQDLLLCDFTDPYHCESLCNLVNEYIANPMGGGILLSDRQKLHLLDGLESHPRAIVLFALYEEKIVGVINAFMNFSTFKCKPMINIHDIYVADNFRGKGLGRKLMRGIEEIARLQDCVKITLEVRMDNPVAQQLYISEGYGEVSDPMYFWTKIL